MKANTTLLLALNLLLFLFAISFAAELTQPIKGIESFGSYVVAYSDDTLYLLDANTLTTLDSVSVNGIKGVALSSPFIFAYTGNSISVYNVYNGKLYTNTGLQPSVSGSISHVWAVGNGLYLQLDTSKAVKGGLQRQTKFLAYSFGVSSRNNELSYSLDFSKTFTGSYALSFAYPDGFLLIDKEGKAIFVSLKGDVKQLNLPRDISVKPLMSNDVVISGNLFGELSMQRVSDSSVIKKVQLDGAVVGLSRYLGRISVLTAKGSLYKVDESLNVLGHTKQSLSSMPLEVDEGVSTFYVLYPSSIVVEDMSRGALARFTFGDAYAFEDLTESGSTLYAAGSLQKATNWQGVVVKIPSASGCIIESSPSTIGYLPFTISGKAYNMQKVSISVMDTEGNTIYTTTAPVKNSSFSITLDPLIFPFSSLIFKCSSPDSLYYDMVKLVRGKNQPKDVFSIKANKPLDSLKENTTVTFTVKEAMGLPVANFTVSVDGKKQLITNPTLTLTFSKKGKHTLVFEKEGFNTKKVEVKVKGLPLLLIGGVVLILLVVAVYWYMSSA